MGLQETSIANTVGVTCWERNLFDRLEKSTGLEGDTGSDVSRNGVFFTLSRENTSVHEVPGSSFIIISHSTGVLLSTYHCNKGGHS